VKTKILYCLPSLISLLLFPIFFTIWIINDKAIKRKANEKVLEFVRLEREMQDEIPQRLFKTYYLRDSNDIKIIESTINNLIFSKDTITGVDIIISDFCKYSNFVSLVNYFLIKNYDYYYPYGSHIKVVYSNNKADKKSYMFVRRIPCGNSFREYTIIDKRSFNIRIREKLHNKLLGFWRLDYRQRIACLLMFGFTIFAMIKINYKNRC
jgi:hypothetical protein